VQIAGTTKQTEKKEKIKRHSLEVAEGGRQDGTGHLHRPAL
jgi:hypothetical protein